jgi:predicted ATPase/DNA-binding XRE family transcriptional regulator
LTLSIVLALTIDDEFGRYQRARECTSGHRQRPSGPRYSRQNNPDKARTTRKSYGWSESASGDCRAPESETAINPFSSELLRLRHRSGWSQACLAERAGLSTEAISLLERGLRAPRRTTLRRLADALGLDREDRTALLLTATLRVPDAYLLPDFADELIGRDSEVGQVTRLLGDGGTRLVTLTGPGGVGKTRVAAAVADQLAGSLGATLRWLTCSSGSPGRLLLDLAAALGFSASSRVSPEAIAAALHDTELLLVIDQAELGVPRVAALCGDLLNDTTGVRILVTSRAPLRMPGETQVPIGCLGLAVRARLALTETVSPAAVATSPACRLFLARASSWSPARRAGADLSTEEAQAVADICARVDGLPLAIEHAASRTHVLSVTELAAALGRSLKVLDTPQHGGDPGLHDVVVGDDFARLSAAEQGLLARLSVFAAPFNHRDVARVCAVEDSSPSVVDNLTQLVSQSLVLRVADVDGHATFTLLRVVREYAAERLERLQDAFAVRQRFAAHLLDLAVAAGDQLDGREQSRWCHALDAQAANLESAFQWLVAFDPESALAMNAGLWRWWQLRGHYDQGRAWSALALSRTPAAAPRLRAPALAASALLALMQCDYEVAQTQAQEALDGFSLVQDNSGVAWALALLGSVAGQRGEYTVAAQLHERALVLAQRDRDQHAVAAQLNALAQVAWLRGSFARAQERGQRALDLMSQVGDVHGVAAALTNLGAAAHYRGDTARAQQLLTASLELSESLDNREGVAWALNLLGMVSRATGDLVTARRRQTASMIEHQRLGNRWRLASVVDELAAVAQASGQPQQARSGLAAAEQLRREIGASVPPAEQPARNETLRAVEPLPGRVIRTAQLADLAGYPC